MVQGRTVLFRTAEGAKLFSAVAKCAVAFEADDHNVAEGWSVIVKVRAQVLTTDPGSAKPNAPSYYRGPRR